MREKERDSLRETGKRGRGEKQGLIDREEREKQRERRRQRERVQGRACMGERY